MTRGPKLLLATMLLAGCIVIGCSSDDDGDGGTGPGDGHPPAAMVDLWLYQNVTVNGNPASLATLLDWDPQAVDGDEFTLLETAGNDTILYLLNRDLSAELKR